MAKVEKVYPLSPLQEGMLYHSLLQENTEMYFQQAAFSIRGDLNLQVFEQSVQQLLQRHDILRTNFVYQKLKKPQQVVLNQRKAAVHYEDFSDHSDHEFQDALQSFLLKDRKTGFNLRKGGLMRFAVFKRGVQDFRMVWSYHHMLLDGWSIGILMDEWFQIYSSLQGQQPPLLARAKPYHEFIQWLNAQDKEKSLHHWKNYLRGYQYRPWLPMKSKPTDREDRYQTIRFSLGKEVTARLIDFSKKHQVTVNTLVQAVWGVLLQRYTNQEDVVFGTVISGRSASIQGIEKMVGLFINTVPVRMTKRDGSFIEWARELQQQLLVSEEHGYCPLYEIQEQQVQKKLFDHIVVFENHPLNQEEESLLSDQRQMVIRDVTSFEQTNYPLTISVNPGKSLDIRLKYHESLNDCGWIGRIGDHFKKAVQTVLTESQISIHQIDILTESEKQQLLKKSNDTDAAYPKEKTIHRWFEEQALKTPNRTAVVFKEERLTYRELNEQANRLAHVLRRSGTRPDERVGLMMERSIDGIVGILAILKAGGAYVPLDPQYPVERLQMMAADSGAKRILSQSGILAKLDKAPFGSVEWLDVQALKETGGDVDNLPPVSRSTDLAYVMYTSGTTGRPKGVMMEHRSLVNLLHDQLSRHEIPFDENVLQFSSISFDVSFQEIFSALLSGGTLLIAENQMKQHIDRLLAYIEDHRISIVFWPVSYVKAVFQLTNRLPRSIQHVITAGEQLVVPPALQRCIRQGEVHVHNHYGPTETHVVTTYRLSSGQDRVEPPPIGKPIANTNIYILHRSGQLQPQGAEGEVHISGDSVSRGYLGNPERTAEAFVPNPFVPGERMYRTGDLARYLPDGNIQFLGRMDHQANIRGYRVEPGEIEAVLLEHPQVNDGVVCDWKDDRGETHLCAYVVWNESGSRDELEAHLRRKLPDYMIPSFILAIDAIPITPNGKVDRPALPAPERSERQAEYVPPATEMEKQLTGIWKQVLGIEPIGVTDHFFQIGGHSLKVIQLLSIIHQKLQVELPVHAIFEHPTIRQLAICLEENKRTSFQPIQPAPVQTCYPVSSAQKRMFVLQKMEPDAIHYNLPGAVVMEGALDIKRLEQAIQQLMKRHESLRTSFEWVEGEPVQKIHSEVSFSLSIRSSTEREVKNRIKQFVRPFSLDQAPLFRVEMIQLEAHKHLLLIDLHHIITDGVSTDVMLSDLSKLYGGETLPDLRIQYKDFAVWQQEWIRSDDFHRQETYWLKSFGNEIPVLELPTDSFRPEVQNFVGSRLDFVLNETLTKSLKKLAEKTGTTLYMLLLAAYFLLLHKYSKQSEVIVGTPVAGRSHADVQSVMGMFVNTLAIRSRPEGDKRVIDFVQEVKREALAAYDHADYPFEMLVEKLSLARDTSRNPLFQAMFTMQDFGSGLLRFDGVQVNPYELDYAVSKFDLSMVTREENGQIWGHLEYATSLFNRETIRRLKQHFEQIVKEIAACPEKTVQEVDMLTDQEKVQLLVEWNPPAIPDSVEKTIHEHFEEQAAKTPTHVAVVCQEEKWTYQQLNERANRLAHALRRRGVKPDDRVGLLMARSGNAVAGILGILKAGGAYVPMDPSYPVERLRYMWEDSGAEMILSQASVVETIPDGEDWIKEWLDVEEIAAAEKDSSNPTVVNRPSDLAYVIYTSGTTGQPKGVMVEHRSVIHLIDHFQNEWSIQEQDRVGQFASLSFDAAVWEMGVSLLSGACLHIIPQDVIADPLHFERYVNRHRLSMLLLPPTYLSHLDRRQMKTLRKIMVGGSASSPSLVEKWKDIYINAYGPTEATVCATVWEPADEESVTVAPVGKPISHSPIYIVDEHLQIQPIGIPGELCIGGAGLARGYLGKPEQTAEAFIPNPFRPGERIYRTGDLARYLPDGNIEFLGRTDHQVKVRGHRIELGEIESVLIRHPKVTDATVQNWREGRDEADLCAYVAVDEPLSGGEVKSYLGRKLPDYMIPSFVMTVDAIPLTPNGKVDKHRLPKPDGWELQAEYAAPVTEMEEKLVRIWKRVLGVQKIGVTHHFFELGGDSIKAIQVAAELQKEDCLLRVNDLFRAPTIQQVIPYIRHKKPDANQGLVKGTVPLTPIQEEFFAHAGPHVNHFNQSVLLYCDAHLQTDVVHQVLTKLIEHHDALRMIYRKEQDRWVQINRGLEESSFQLHTFDLRYQKDAQSQIEKLADQMQRSLDITKGLLINVGLFQTDEGDYILFVIHHLVVDGVSWRILLEDFESGYQQAVKQQPIRFPKKTDAFLTWAHGLQEAANSSKIKKEIPYWERLCQTELTPLPKDREVKERLMGDSGQVEVTLSEEQTTQLLTQIHHAYNTEINDILLAAVGLTVKDWSRTDHVGIVLEGHGREEMIESISLHRTVGWFTSCYPVVLGFDDEDGEEAIDDRLSRSIKNVKETLRRIPHRGIGYGMLKYLSRPEMRPAHLAAFHPEIAFNYLGQFGQSGEAHRTFQISTLKTGRLANPHRRRTHAIDLNGLVFDGKFTLQIGYSCKEYDQETMMGLAQHLKQNLDRLIKHCLEKSETEATPSDVGDKDLSLEDLEYMRSVLES
ncbi:non-ribosomal peptide synthetase [Desmospora profundinema]|uniref:Amino acid adenylation domain-containing protein/non-ribosomal peptide synthase protein (TIGR01720 family) n=1 Tax=Desmospora profundinema TaxID=1571184 RepID=A0ABU1IIS8_9BACL|nr:non-ribosomal peptide synthetase [Desmospora profundinema]MDR6224079.1 amino acid adenylation domain-containing protein/non-ribosomal peptide synthase protein (TIGR01720 family) [Desmospora profundinema]